MNKSSSNNKNFNNNDDNNDNSNKDIIYDILNNIINIIDSNSIYNINNSLLYIPNNTTNSEHTSIKLDKVIKDKYQHILLAFFESIKNNTYKNYININNYSYDILYNKNIININDNMIIDNNIYNDNIYNTNNNNDLITEENEHIINIEEKFS